MYPYLIIGSLKIPMYSLMMCLGIVAFAALVVYVIEKKEKTDRKTVNNMIVVTAIGGVIMYVSAFLFNSLFHSIESGKVELGGITWLGGVLGAFPLMIFLLHKFCPRIKGKVLFYFGLMMPAVAVGHALGRFGCFFAGCCYGTATDSFLGVTFPDMDHAVLPTQLFEAVYELLLFAVMMIFYKKLREHFLETWLLGYGAFRFILEFFRGDDRGATGFFLSPSQAISVILIVAAVLLILYHKGIVFKKFGQKMAEYRKESEKYGVYIRGDVAYTLRQLKDLQKDGVLSQEEYEAYKKDLESRI